MSENLTAKGTPRKRSPRPGEGRKPAGTTRLNVRITLAADAAARECAEQEGMDLGQWVSRAILKAVGQ
ncbi:MAG: hypothetical protein EOP87_00095 [Verrucomicrobiaceae bacterium]|nr:MAG: hypothetical protein EOP87_00095 [Verrucomicrobiaceae bacterium]